MATENKHFLSLVDFSLQYFGVLIKIFFNVIQHRSFSFAKAMSIAISY